MLSKKIRTLLIRTMVMVLVTSAAVGLAPAMDSWTGGGYPALQVMAAEASGTVTVTASSLWTYSSPDWAARSKVVYRGNQFVVTEKISVAGRDMYKLSNGMYITANPAYVSASVTTGTTAPAPSATVSVMAATANLNMRSGPGTGYSILKVIPKGAQVQASTLQSGFYKVTYGGTTGWASASYLSAVSTTPAPAPAPAPATSYVKTVANLNMRTGPSTGYGILATIPVGTRVQTSGMSGGWYKVIYNGNTGWVAGTYVVTVSGYSEKVLTVPYISQYAPVYAPMGCEGASLLMALQYKGYTGVGLKAFLDQMPLTERNPYLGFASTPYQVITGNPPIFQSIFPVPLTAYGQRYSANVFNISGYDTSQLKAEIDKGNPVTVYVTTPYFAEPTWKVFDMGEAGNVSTVSNMHIMVLTGYNSDGEYHMTDPAASRNRYWVSGAKFEAAYNALKWAVVVR